jgi:hypothetical protein
MLAETLGEFRDPGNQAMTRHKHHPLAKVTRCVTQHVLTAVPFLWTVIRLTMTNRLAILVFAGWLGCGLLGCGGHERIETYNVPKKTPRRVARPAAPAAAMNGRPSVPTRILGAIVPVDRKAWFFKVEGPGESVAGQAECFTQFMESVRFSDAKEPTWSLPDGWAAEPGRGMRFATIRIGDGEPPLELTVIPLSVPDDDLAAYILSNVNRWRGQVGIADLSAGELADHSKVIDLDGYSATLVNVGGTAAAAAGGTLPPGHPPLAGTPGSSAAGPAGNGDGTSGSPASSAAGLSYKTPEEWSPAAAGGMRRAAFQVRDGDNEVEITIIDLSATAGDLLSNVNRWRRQVQLPPIGADDLEQQTRSIDFAGTPAKLVELVAPENVSPRETILGVIAVRGDKSWYIKLKGDSALAAREKERFEAFVQSIRFPGSEEE